MAAPIISVAAAMESSSSSNLSAFAAGGGGFRVPEQRAAAALNDSDLQRNRSSSTTNSESRYNHLDKLESGRVRCNLCNSTYSCLISARAHTVRVHEQPDYFECSLCAKIFRTKLNFRSHLNLSHGIKGSNLVAKYGRLVDMVDEYNMEDSAAAADMLMTNE